MLTYRNSDSHTVVEFGTAALDHFVRNRQLHNSAPEAGGQLFATFDGLVARVEIATGPRPTDLRSRFGFRPNRRAEQQEIKQMFKRGFHYVGDWHTHPTQIPQPSMEDLRNIRAAVKNSVHELRGFLLVVVGNAVFPVGLSVTLDTGERTLALQCSSRQTESAPPII